jgi:hypothetical protein
MCKPFGSTTPLNTNPTFGSLKAEAFTRFNNQLKAEHEKQK